MSTLPFSISPDAAAWIAEKLKMVEKEPAVAGLLPALYFSFNYQNRDEEGRVFEWCPHSFFDIGWFRPETVASHGFVEMEIVGLKVFAPLDTLERLKGKQLVLETVEVGFPRASDKQRQLLRAVPEEL
jgi:hypothetical protein